LGREESAGLVCKPGMTIKPFGFALSMGPTGARIYYGQLHTSVTRVLLKAFTSGDSVVRGVSKQEEIPTVTVHDPFGAFSIDARKLKAIELGWFGDVFLKWKITVATGEVTDVAISGPDTPTSLPVDVYPPELPATERTVTVGEYYVKIGSVSSSGDVVQEISGDVTWAITLATPDEPGGAIGTNHPWKVAGTGTEDEYVVLPDPVYGQGGPISVTGAVTLTCVGAGEIYLQVTRNVASRVLETAVLGFASVTPASDYTDQYRAIARLDGYGGILQLQQQEIRLYEVRIIANGASKLVDFDISSRIDYDLPP